MITMDRFTEIVEEELALLPEYAHEELNGGVLIDPKVYMHPARLADDLYILGTYTTDPVFGKQIVLSTDDSTIKIAVIPTNEELAIARDTLKLV